MIHSYYLLILGIAHSTQKEREKTTSALCIFVFNRLKCCKQQDLSHLSFTLTHPGTNPSCSSTVPAEDRFPWVKAGGLQMCFARVSAVLSPRPDHGGEQTSHNSISQGTLGTKTIWESNHKHFLYELLMCSNGSIDIYSPFAISPHYTFWMHRKELILSEELLSMLSVRIHMDLLTT